MQQSKIHLVHGEKGIKSLLDPVEQAFEEEGYAISAHEVKGKERIWELAVYCPTAQTSEVKSQLKRIVEAHFPSIDVMSEDLPETNWVAETLASLPAIRAGRFIVHGTHERHTVKANEIGVWIDAGLAFGTGHHGTTAGCLEMLHRVSKYHAPQRVLDLGCGSGILAIAAAKKFRTNVTATDIDPLSIITTDDNARLNNVQSLVKSACGDGLNHNLIRQNHPFDLVLANILARPLQSMATDLCNATAAGGIIILSGLLPHQKAPLVARFRAEGCHLLRYHIKDGWLILCFRKM